MASSVGRVVEISMKLWETIALIIEQDYYIIKKSKHFKTTVFS